MQVLKARLDQFGVKYKDVGNNTVAVWHPSMKMVANVHRASGEQAPDLEKSLRDYEAAHKVWFSTPVHTDAGKAAKKSLDEARTAYEDAVRYHRPGTIIM